MISDHLCQRRGDLLPGQGRSADDTAHYNRGLALRSLGRYDEAIEAFNRTLALRPDHPGTLYDHARLYSLWEKSDQALADLRDATEGDAKYKRMALRSQSFDNIRDDPRFQELVAEPTPPEGDDASEPAPLSAGRYGCVAGVVAMRTVSSSPAVRCSAASR